MLPGPLQQDHLPQTSVVFFWSSPGPSWAFRIVRSKGWVMKLCRALPAEILHVGSSEGFVFFVFPLSMTLIHVLLHPWVWTSKMFGCAMYNIYYCVYIYIHIHVNSATYHLFTKIFNQCLFIFSLATVSFLWISIGHVNHLHGQSFNILKPPRKRYSISNQRHWSTVYDMEIVCPLGVFAPKLWERLIKVSTKLDFSIFKGTISDSFLRIPRNPITPSCVSFAQNLPIVGMQPLLWPPILALYMLERCRYALEQEKLRQKLTSKSDFLARRGAAWLLKDWGWRSRPSRLVFSIADSCCWAWGTSE